MEHFRNEITDGRWSDEIAIYIDEKTVETADPINLKFIPTCEGTI